MLQQLLHRAAAAGKAQLLVDLLQLFQTAGWQPLLGGLHAEPR
jgi:hypothetical protein